MIIGIIDILIFKEFAANLLRAIGIKLYSLLRSRYFILFFNNVLMAKFYDGRHIF